MTSKYTARLGSGKTLNISIFQEQLWYHVGDTSRGKSVSLNSDQFDKLKKKLPKIEKNASLIRKSINKKKLKKKRDDSSSESTSSSDE